MRVCLAVFLGLLSAGVGSPALAGLVTINANIGGATLDGTVQAGLTPVDPVGTAWNDLGADVTSADLKDSSGTMTGIGVELTGSGGNALPGFVFGNPSSALSGGPDILDDYMVATNSFGPLLAPVEFAFTGLDTSATYNFFFVTQGDQNDQGGTITLDGLTATAAGDNRTGPLAEGENYVAFLGVTPSASTIAWSLSLGSNPNNLNFAALNGFQIQAVPEPASIWFVLPWLAACVGRRGIAS